MFKRFWIEASKSLECLNTTNSQEAYYHYLSKNEALRFSKPGEYVPNLEIKFSKNSLDQFALTHRKKVILNHHLLFISPLELQISFKLSLGSQKDIEDARFLYRLFKEKLDQELLLDFNRKLKVEQSFRNYLE